LRASCWRPCRSTSPPSWCRASRHRQRGGLAAPGRCRVARPPAAALRCERSAVLLPRRAVSAVVSACPRAACGRRPALRCADAGARWLQVCARVWRAPALCGSVRAPPPRRPCAAAGRGPCTGDEKGAWRPGTAPEPARARPAVPRCAATLRGPHPRRWLPGIDVSTGAASRNPVLCQRHGGRCLHEVGGCAQAATQIPYIQIDDPASENWKLGPVRRHAAQRAIRAYLLTDCSGGHAMPACLWAAHIAASSCALPGCLFQARAHTRTQRKARWNADTRTAYTHTHVRMRTGD